MAEETLALIEKVRNCEFLYNNSHELYKNMAKKAEAWNTISGELNMPCDIAKMKWKNLRDCYLRFKKSSRGPTGMSKKYHKWPWSRYMRFLDDSLHYRPRIRNVPIPIKMEVSTSPTAETQSLFEATESTDWNESQPSPASSRMPPPHPQKNLVLESKAHESEVDEVIEYSRSKPRKRYYDSIDHLFHSYSDTFRTFKPMTQAMLKIELATLFARTEMKELGTPLDPTPSHSGTSASEVPQQNVLTQFSEKEEQWNI